MYEADGKIVEKKTAKGVKLSVKETHLKYRHYYDCLKSFCRYIVKQNLIRSKTHTINTIHSVKIGLSTFDTKRWLCENGEDTLAFGHYETL